MPHPPPRKRTSTTRLPFALREELGLVDGERDRESNQRRPRFQFRKASKKIPLTRKESRKQARYDKKHHKSVNATAGSKPSRQSPNDRKRPAGEHAGQAPPKKRQRLESTQPRNVSKLQRPAVTFADPSESGVPHRRTAVERSNSDHATDKKPPRTKPTALEKLAAKADAKQPQAHVSTSRPSSGLAAPLSLNRAEQDEDDEIDWLEHKLGLNKRDKKGKKKYSAFFEEDGLDDLLDDVDRIVSSVRGAAPRDTRQDHDISDGGLDESSGEENVSSSNEESGGEEDGFDEMESDVLDEDDVDEEEGGTDSEDDDNDELTAAMHPTVKSTPPTGRYVPPALRKSSAQEAKSEAQIKLSRQLKGLLNKLSDQNIGSILDDIEALYRTNSRNDVTASLTELIITSISSHSSLLDTFVILHAALIAALYKIIGIEFAAYFVQTLVTSYERHYAEASNSLSTAPTAEDGGDELVKGKEASNLLVLLAELYTFQVVSCVLIYDIIRSFLATNLGEFEVELFLKLLKAIGVQLRQDDPTALKEIVQLVQSKTAGQDKASQSSRTRFMLETLSNLKNNKVLDNKRKAGGNVAADAVDKMKRFVKSLSSKKTVRGTEPLNVSLEDLRSADKKGKWWLVGSAWGGDPLAEAAAVSITALDVNEEYSVGEDQSAALLKLAKRQGMNTEVRRNIFVVLMSSDDYVDACDRLGQLKIKEQQRPEVVRVLLHCLGNEKAYNPYYTLVAQHLSTLSRNTRFSLQYCLWDLLKEFGESISGDADEEEEKVVAPSRMRNLSKAYAWWVAKGGVGLDIFKPLNFLALKPQTRTFLRQFFPQMFVSSQTASPLLDYTTTSTKDGASLSRDRSVIEVIMMRPLKHPNVVQGILHFLKTEDLVGLAKEESVRDCLEWAVGLSTETLGAGEEVAEML